MVFHCFVFTCRRTCCSIRLSDEINLTSTNSWGKNHQNKAESSFFHDFAKSFYSFRPVMGPNDKYVTSCCPIFQVAVGFSSFC